MSHVELLYMLTKKAKIWRKSDLSAVQGTAAPQLVYFNC